MAEEAVTAVEAGTVADTGIVNAVVKGNRLVKRRHFS